MGGKRTEASMPRSIGRPPQSRVRETPTNASVTLSLVSYNPATQNPSNKEACKAQTREREKREASQIKPRCPHHGATKGRHLAACHRPPPSAWRRGRAWPSPCEGGRPSGRKHRCVTVGRHATVLTGLVGLLLPVSILITRPTYAQPPDYDTV